jgi:PAS domain S-box-containing protein
MQPTAILDDDPAGVETVTAVRREEALLKAGALQNAIFNSANFSSIATDAKGVIQIFNVGAERMLGYAAGDVLNKITPADISDPQEVIARAKALSIELATTISPGFEALVFKASRGIEDIYELTYIRKDGSRFPAIVSVTALRDEEGGIIGYLLIGTDNTARKKAEEALLKAGALQNAIFNSANFSSIATDAKGVIQIFNVGAERMLGYAAGDVLNKITPADISDPQEVIARAKALSVELATTITPGFEALVFKASRGIEDIYELTYIRKDGSRFPAIVSVTALRDQPGGIIGYLLIGTDNTARKKAEEALLKAGALQNAIFNSANFSSIATDAKGVIQIFNVGAERMLGYAAGDVLNKITPADISDPQEVIARAKALSVELATTITPGFEALVFKASRGIEDIYELTYIRKDGSRFPAIVSVTALRDEQGGIIGYLLIGTDNTARIQVEEERKKLDQRLRDQQFYTRSLIESNIDALMTTDPLGIITDVNKQMEALTGCTRDELIGAPFKNYFTDPDRAEAAIKLVLNQKKVTNYELTASDRDGKKTVVSYNATTFYDRDRRLQGVFAAARDVTERQRFEQALQESNVQFESAKSAAEKANLAKSDFLSSMSHELRSPLNAILGFAQLMESSAPAPTATQAESIAQILQAGWHLLKLINEILDLAVIESGKVSLSPESVLLSELMSECQAMMEPQAQQHGISMTFPRLNNERPLFVQADRTRLKQIIINLLSNAIKYNKEHGTVAVDCALHGLDRIRISVADSGAGLPPEKLAQLFQPFNRLGQEASGVAGTGIGLVVTKRLAELMEGTLGVESTVGLGSVFWCELIAAAAPQLAILSGPVEATVRPELPAGAPRRTLLYVEDNPANMKLVQQLISRCPDIDLLTAVNGTLGIEIARASQPQVILMDVNLPGISGIEAMKILRDDPSTAHIPIVALSANAMPRDIAMGLELGFFRYLTKPIKVKEFMDTLNVALDFAESSAITAVDKHEQRPLQILLAEDNVANRRLATINLEKWGHRVTVASNGDDAVAAVKIHNFDLVLMDMQMPRSNGLEATAAIRRREEKTKRRVPIIAVTANAMAGHRENCLKAGMDDFVTKPIRYHELLAAMQRVVPNLVLQKPGANVFDRTALMASLGGNTTLLRELVQLSFDSDAPRLLGELREAAAKRDPCALEAACHGLNGLLGELRASRAVDMARRLEDDAHAGDLTDLDQRVAGLLSEMEQLKRQLQQFVAALNPS